MFLVGQPADPWFINGPVLDQFRSLTSDQLSGMFVVHDRSRFRILFFPADAARVKVYQYGVLGASQIRGESSAADPLDLRQGAWWDVLLPTGFQIKCATVVERSADVPELWAGGSDGFVYRLQDPSATSWANTASTEAVAAEIETQAVRS